MGEERIECVVKVTNMKPNLFTNSKVADRNVFCVMQFYGILNLVVQWCVKVLVVMLSNVFRLRSKVGQITVSLTCHWTCYKEA